MTGAEIRARLKLRTHLLHPHNQQRTARGMLGVTMCGSLMTDDPGWLPRWQRRVRPSQVVESAPTCQLCQKSQSLRGNDDE